MIDDVDVWIAPSGPIPAFPHQRGGAPLEIDDRSVSYGLAMGLYHCPLTLTGAPVVALPIGLTDEGLPVGAQLVGKRWDDWRLLDIAAAIEARIGGFTPPPGFANDD